jgi:MFS family permease
MKARYSPKRVLGVYTTGVTRQVAVVSGGVLVLRLGAFLSLFLTLILARRDYSPEIITVALLVVALAGVAGAGMSGMIANRVGRRSALLVSCAAISVSAAGAAITHALIPTVAFAAAANAGTQAYNPVAQSVVSLESAPEHRVSSFAFYRLMLNVGASVAPTLGVFLLTWSSSGLLWINSLTGLAAGILILKLSNTGENPGNDAGATSRHDVNDDGWSPRSPNSARRAFLALCALMGIVALVYAQQGGVLALAIKNSRIGIHYYGFLLTLNTILVLLFEVPSTRISKRWKRGVALGLGAACVCGGYAFNLVGISVLTLLIGTLIWTLGEMLLGPLGAAVASESAPAGRVANYQSILAFSQTLGLTLGPAAGVLAYSYDRRLPWLLCLAGLAVTSPSLFLLVPRARAIPQVADK